MTSLVFSFILKLFFDLQTQTKYEIYFDIRGHLLTQGDKRILIDFLILIKKKIHLILPEYLAMML